jgi:hypothetical protein
MAQMVEHLLSHCETLSSNPDTTKSTFVNLYLSSYHLSSKTCKVKDFFKKLKIKSSACKLT